MRRFALLVFFMMLPLSSLIICCLLLFIALTYTKRSIIFPVSLYNKNVRNEK